MNFADRVRMFLGEASKAKKEAGYKAMATSSGGSVKETKKELKKLDKNGTTEGIVKRAKTKDDPMAYKYGSLQKILRRHQEKLNRGK
jgi:hypothetical protein